MFVLLKMLLPKGFLDTERLHSHPPRTETKNDPSHSCTLEERAEEGAGVSKGTGKISKTGSGRGERDPQGYSTVGKAPYIQSYPGELCDESEPRRCEQR